MNINKRRLTGKVKEKQTNRGRHNSLSVYIITVWLMNMHVPGHAISNLDATPS